MSSHQKHAVATGDGIQWDHPAAAGAEILDADQGLITLGSPPRKRLAIVGFAASTRDDAPFDDPTWFIVGLNQLYRHIPRADAWIDIHANWNDPTTVVEGTDYLGWLQTAPIPIFMCQRQPGVPTSVTFPLVALLARFKARYFTSTIAYLIAWGLHVGVEAIGIWGVDLAVGGEYFWEKPCAEFWLGAANALGVELRLPAKSALCRSAVLYGYETAPDWPVTVEMLRKRDAVIEKERQGLLARLHTLDGALAENRYWGQYLELRLRGAEPVIPELSS